MLYQYEQINTGEPNNKERAEPEVRASLPVDTVSSMRLL